jgi:hypothetical protein
MRYKENVAQITNTVDKIKNLTGIYFEWTPDSPFYKDFSGINRIGLSAQNIHEEFPELVTSGEASGASGQIIPDFHSVWYDRMAGVFVEAIKEIDYRLRVVESGVL